MGKYKRYWTTKQRRNYDCGITCMINVLRYYGKKVSRSDFKELLLDVRIRKNGASIWDLVNIAKKYGIKAEGVKCDWQTLLRKGFCPAILVVELGLNNFHYIVVYEVNEVSIVVADPSVWTARIAEMTMPKFTRRYHWQGEAILFLKSL